MRTRVTRCRRRVVAGGLLAFIGCVGSDPTYDTTTPYAPSITTQPIPAIVTRGDSVVLTVVATGTAPISYQWYRNDLAIAADTLATLKIAATVPADSGVYYVTVTNSVTSVTSASVLVSVVPKVSSLAWRQEGGAAGSTAQAYSSAVADESAVFVFHSGVLTLDAPNVSKLAASTNLKASREQGLNAAILSASNSRIYITGGLITSDGLGAAALFATGAGAKVALTGGYVSTLGAESPAVAASNGATVVITGGTLAAAASDAIVVSAAGDSAAPVMITVAGAAVVSAGTGTLFSVVNGGAATLTLDGEVVTGRAHVDGSSAATVVLQNSTSWNGAMDGGALTLDATSLWMVAATSSLTVITNPTIIGDTITNIVGNGFTVTYTAALEGNAALGSRTYSLAGGGRLVPR